jgi:hypothetical protein
MSYTIGCGVSAEWGHSFYNRDVNNQFRFVTSLRRDDYQIPNDQDAEAAGIRDIERERDALASFSWVHTFQAGPCFKS